MEECGDAQRSLFYFISGGVWGLFEVFWMVNTLATNQQHTKPLQRIMGFVLFFKFLHNMFLGSLTSSCPDSGAYPYWGLATTSTYTLYNTFIYTTLILISKGFGITRDILERGEVTVVAMTMGAVYLGFSAYMIQQLQLSPLLIIILGVLFYLCQKFCSSNIRALKLRYNFLVSTNVRAMLPPIREKLRMMKVFQACIYFYYIEQLFTLIFLEIGAELVANPGKPYWLGITVWGDSAEFLTLFLIYWTFRSRDHGQYFNLSEVVDDQPVLNYVPFYKSQPKLSSGSPNHELPLLLLPPESSSLKICLPLRQSPSNSFHWSDSLNVPLLAFQ